MEPLYECGRCVTSKKKSPEPEKFLRNLILAREAGKKLGIEIVFSSGNLKELRNKYCGAAGNNFCITQDGFVTSCYEVMRQSDPRSIHFFYGKFNEDKKQFEFDEKKRKVLASREVRNLPYCRDCFAKFNCGGECLAKVASSKDLFSPCNYDSKCTINRGILLSQLEGVLTEQGEKNG
jgi:radical SAM protein with 4Fe4S-binding SPASM domain